MAWFGPQTCNCQCCRCTPVGVPDCTNRCDNNTTGIENIYITLENWPAGVFEYFTRELVFGKYIIKTSVSGNEGMNVNKRLVASRAFDQINPGYGIFPTSCTKGGLCGYQAIRFTDLLCCYRIYPFTVEYKVKWEIKFYDELNGLDEPCNQWDDPHSEYYSHQTIQRWTWNNQNAALPPFLSCLTNWYWDNKEDCPDFGTSANALIAKGQCNANRGVNFFLQGGLINPGLNIGISPNGWLFCGEQTRQQVQIGTHGECNGPTSTYIGYFTWHVDKFRTENPYQVPAAYEVIISDLPNKYYFYDDQSGSEAVEITGLDQFNGTYNLEAGSNGCLESPYVEQIDVDVAAFSISRWQFPTGNCTNTPFPNPFPANGVAVLRLPPGPRSGNFFELPFYDWIAIEVDNPFTGVGKLTHTISTQRGIGCSEVDDQKVPGNTCLPNPNPYFRIRIRPIY